MGTRNLTIVKSKGKTKVAQYGQWDGYPTGQGATIADFLRKVDIEEFTKQVDALREATPEEIDGLCKPLGDKWKEKYPQFSRDEGAGILELIHTGGVTFLALDEDFKNDSLFCEYYYTIDLDKRTVSVNGGKEYKFSSWTNALMKRLEKRDD